MVKKNQTSSEQKESSTGSSAGKVAQFKEYVELSRLELRKVSWPTWKETRVTSLIVLAFVFVMSLLLGVVDLGLSKLVTLILA